MHVNVDNAANVQGAAHDLDCDCDGCAAHKFNLIAKDGIKASPEIKEVQTKTQMKRNVAEVHYYEFKISVGFNTNLCHSSNSPTIRFLVARLNLTLLFVIMVRSLKVGLMRDHSPHLQIILINPVGRCRVFSHS